MSKLHNNSQCLNVASMCSWTVDLQWSPLLKENTYKTDVVQELSVFISHLLKETDSSLTTSQGNEILNNILLTIQLENVSFLYQQATPLIHYSYTRKGIRQPQWKL